MKKKKQHNALGSDRAGDSGRVSEKPSGAVTPAWKGASKEGLGGTVSDSGNSQRKGLRRELSLLKEQTEGQCGQTTVGKGWVGHEAGLQFAAGVLVAFNKRSVEVKFTFGTILPVEVYDPVTFSLFRVVPPSLTVRLRTFSSPPKKTSYPSAVTAPFPRPPPQTPRSSSPSSRSLASYPCRCI